MRQCVCDSAAAYAATSGYGHPQRRGQPIGDRGATRVGHLGGKSLQLVDENLLPLFDRVFRQLDPYHRPIVIRWVHAGGLGLPLEW